MGVVDRTVGKGRRSARYLDIPADRQHIRIFLRTTPKQCTPVWTVGMVGRETLRSSPREIADAPLLTRHGEVLSPVDRPVRPVPQSGQFLAASAGVTRTGDRSVPDLPRG